LKAADAEERLASADRLAKRYQSEAIGEAETRRALDASFVRQSTTFQLREATLLDQISSMHQQLGELQCTSQHKDTHINSGDQHSSHVPTEIPDAHVDMASSGSSGAKADSNGAKLPKGIDHSRTRRLSGLVDRADWQVR